MGWPESSLLSTPQTATLDAQLPPREGNISQELFHCHKCRILTVHTVAPVLMDWGCFPTIYPSSTHICRCFNQVYLKHVNFTKKIHLFLCFFFYIVLNTYTILLLKRPIFALILFTQFSRQWLQSPSCDRWHRGARSCLRTYIGAVYYPCGRLLLSLLMCIVVGMFSVYESYVPMALPVPSLPSYLFEVWRTERVCLESLHQRVVQGLVRPILPPPPQQLMCCCNILLVG